MVEKAKIFIVGAGPSGLADALAEAVKAPPRLGDDIEFARVNRWYPVLVYSHPGFHLAGSYNSSGNVNTATTTGERAARKLLAALRHPTSGVTKA